LTAPYFTASPGTPFNQPVSQSIYQSQKKQTKKTSLGGASLQDTHLLFTLALKERIITMHNKGPAPQLHDGSGLRIGIVHARWNDAIISELLAGAKAKLLECGVKESNIVVESVPGAWELPIAVQRCANTCP